MDAAQPPGTRDVSNDVFVNMAFVITEIAARSVNPCFTALSVKMMAIQMLYDNIEVSTKSHHRSPN